jgi:type II secretory pathway component GspD/PulD (secretin)
MNFLKDTNSLVFTGDDASLKKLSDILPTFDVSAEAVALSKSNFMVYKIQHAPEEQLENSLSQMADNLEAAPTPDQALIDAIHSMKFIKDTNSLVFTGSSAALAKLTEVLPTFDVPPSGAGLAAQLSPSQFFIYNPKNRSGEELRKSLSDIADNLKDSGLSDPAFLQTVDTVKWVPGNNSLIFTGTPDSLKRVQEMLTAMDTARESHQKGEVYLYKPKYVSSDMLQEALQELSSNLDTNNPTDTSLQDAIDNAKWIEDSQSILFRADPPTIARIKELLTDLDTPEGLTGGGAHTFYLYKLQNAPGNYIVENLEHVSDNLKSSKVPNQALILTISNAKWIKDNNSILLTGSAASIDQTKKIIEQFDVPGAMAPLPGSNKSSFFIYKPVHQPPQAVQIALEDFEKDLGASGLIDPDLMLTLNTMRYVDATQSLLFTGTPDSLAKAKEIISKIDVITPQEAQIQQLGEHTFLIYKIQYVPAGQLLTALKGLSTDLESTGAIDQSVAEAINSMKYIKETNSVLFVGSAAALEKVELMIKKFDIPTLAPRTDVAPPGTFVVYTPKFQPGDELISILGEFEQNLVASGLANPSLFNTINNLKYIAKTCSILISGDTESIAKVEDLLRRFDVPNKEAVPTTSIESIENTSFLIYKLQYHQGSEILSALKQISSDVLKGNAATNQNLLNAVNSLQWIRVTNSLLGTGEPETLTKLKDLIQNLDVPLRQVFIEILVLETSLTNTQNFGLQWGGKMQYLDRFGAGSGNFPLASPNSSPTTNGSNSSTNLIGAGINAVSPASTNNGINPSSSTTGIPFTTGFDLGIIGDIIMHKGKSFISLGSLVNALQTDTDSQIVMNPKIITQDNRNSTIFVGNNVPFAGSLVSTTSSLNQSTTNLEYRDIGFNLSITPTIGNNDIVTLEINNDISEVIAPLSNTSSTNTTLTGITTSHTSMNTRVHVPNNHFVVLSGMIQDTKTHFRSQIPCLGGIPVIGLAFSESDRLDTKQNVLIFVRPHIVNTYEEYKEITSQQETLFKDQAVFPILKEEIDAGLDMVKTPENE